MCKGNATRSATYCRQTTSITPDGNDAPNAIVTPDVEGVSAIETPVVLTFGMQRGVEVFVCEKFTAHDVTVPVPVVIAKAWSFPTGDGGLVPQAPIVGVPPLVIIEPLLSTRMAGIEFTCCSQNVDALSVFVTAPLYPELYRP